MQPKQPDQAILVAMVKPTRFAAGAAMCGVWGAAAWALPVAPRLAETRFLQGLPRLRGISISCAGQCLRLAATLPLFRLT
jgi:hypothetical protein